jgi:hypothetical protein
MFKSIVLAASMPLTLLMSPASAAQAQNSADLYANESGYIWVTIGADAFKSISERHQKRLQLKASSQQQLLTNNANKTQQLMSTSIIAQVKASQLNELSQIMHDDYNRCAGFIAHSSYQDAKAAQQSPQTYSSKAIEYTIDNPTSVAELLTQLQASNLESTVANMSAFNNRYFSQQSGAEASDWLKGEWDLIANSRDDISVEYYRHSGWAQPSVIATIEGTLLPDEIVVIGGHLDSINGSNPSTGRAPGADDNASGIAVVTETLNAIVASGFKPERTIKLMGYAAEEVGLRGSDEIAAVFAQDNLDVVGVAQFDMTGHRGTIGQDFTFITDYTNQLQTEYMTDLIDTYLPELSYGFDVCGYACSDHASWTRYGFASSFPFESTFRSSNGRIHTSSDSAFNSAHAINFAKLSAIYVAELAKGSTEISSAVSSLSFVSAEIQTEVNSIVTIEIRRVGPNQSAASIDFETTDGSAIAGTDYQATSGTVSWDALDNTSKQISVTVNSVNIDKDFTINLSNPQGGELGTNTSIKVVVKAPVEAQPAPDESSSGGGGALGLITGLFLLMLRNRKK